MFDPLKKQLDHELKIMHNSKKLYQNDSVGNLEIEMGKNLAWKSYVKHVAMKTNKGNTLISYMRHYLDIKIYHVIFDSHLMFHWFMHKIHNYKELIFFLNRNAHSDPLFKNLKF